MKGFRKVALLGLFLAATTASGCATTNSAGGGSALADVISREEIVGTEGVRTMYELVQRLRPRWLTIRAGDRSFGMSVEIAVYQGQTYLGDVETLRQLGPTMAYEIQYMDGQKAMNTLPGISPGKHYAGAIIIVTSAPGS
jgi:hypothetical protein